MRTRFPRRNFNGAKSAKNANSEGEYPFVVQVLPLDKAAVATYAKARGVLNISDFLEALKKAHAWELARRPADVNDLIAYWRDTGNLGTLTKILEFVCESQLRKTSDRERSDLLSLERAQTGAEYLAAATVFCRKFNFKIPGEIIESASALEALACLPSDWRNEETRALLNYPLFDGASFGHIRFHHRRLSEFLAARWLNRLMEQGCPVGNLEDTLFDLQGAKGFLRPSLAPIAAWLCAGAERWNMTVCRRVIELAPESLLSFGDPASLTVEDRRALLKSLLKKAGGRKHLWWDRDRANLSRLSDSALAEDINGLIADHSGGLAIREIALEIVVAGKLKECAQTALQAAIDDLNDGEYFPTASSALKIVGNISHLQDLKTAAKDVGRFSPRVCVPLCELLFPKVWTVQEFFHALRKMEPVTQTGIGWDYHLAQHLEVVTSKENGLALLHGFLGHPIQDLDIEDEEFEAPLSLRAALTVSNVMLDWNTLSKEESATIAEVLVQVGDRRSYLKKEEAIYEKTRRHSEVRERYFRLASERIAKEHNFSDLGIASVGIFYENLKPIGDDLLWCLSWLENSSSVQERERALRWSLEIWEIAGRTCEGRIQLKQAVQKFPDLRKRVRKYFYPGLFYRVKAFWYRQVRYRALSIRWRMIWWKIENHFQELRGAWNIWRYRSELRSGKYVGWLAALSGEACDESRSQWSPNDWSLLEKKRGARCALVVKEGCRKFWRSYEPPLPHLRKPNESATNGAIVGLAGIKVEWDEGLLDFARLTLSDARRAACYALSELNGFAPWFDDLARSQPEAVTEVLRECILGEWEIAENSEHHHLVIHDLAWGESVAANLIRPEIVRLLSCGEPKNFHILRDALCVLVSPPSPDIGELASLAEYWCFSSQIFTSNFTQWMAIWLQADALPAIQVLESRLASSDDAVQMMVAICSNLGGRSGYRLPLLQDPSVFSPIALDRFIPLIYRYVRVEDDIDRAGGGVYTSEARDDAQDIRNALLSKLAATRGPEAHAVLQRLLSDPLLSHHYDYMRHLLEKHRGEMAEGAPWRAGDIRRFSVEYERDPQTDADLFRIGVKRVLDLKKWVEEGDDSPRKEVHREDNESGFRALR